MFQLSHPECQFLQTNSLSDDTIWRWSCDHPCEVEHRDCSLPQMHGGKTHRRDSWQPKGTASFANVGRIPRFGDSPKIPSLFPWTVLHLQFSQKNRKISKALSLKLTPMTLPPSRKQLFTAAGCISEAWLVSKQSDFGGHDYITTWHAGPINGNRSSCWAYVGQFRTLRAWSTIFHILVGLFACFVGPLWKQRVSFRFLRFLISNQPVLPVLGFSLYPCLKLFRAPKSWLNVISILRRASRRCWRWSPWIIWSGMSLWRISPVQVRDLGCFNGNLTAFVCHFFLIHRCSSEECFSLSV